MTVCIHKKIYLYYSAHVTQTIYSPKMQKSFFSTKANGQCIKYFVLYTDLLCPCLNRHLISTADPSKMSVFQFFLWSPNYEKKYKFQKRMSKSNILKLQFLLTFDNKSSKSFLLELISKKVI